MKSNLSNREINDITSQQLFSLERKIYKNEFSIETVGNYLPGNVLVTNLNNFSTEYMNTRGCNILMHSAEELAQLGPEYFQKFFVMKEMKEFTERYIEMHQKQDSSFIYNFAHRVKPLNTPFYKWYFASAKLLYEPGQEVSNKMIVIVNEVNTLGAIAKKINSVLDESDWMKKNFSKFCRLTPKEREIICLLVVGNNSAKISDILCVSQLTINTHRRNIKTKLEIKTFAELYKFANTYGLCS
ncbi:helix-turn-helix transcriptional regulator [Flavobacterium franklandianum]|uniref:Helix-turn-helix transcriptional regulator n=1 Tax=Flavobacterium franklandianum TaxID=2594430 RepID=A0A553C604_9FLAO|nr:helix-turn-helix transcriptional regulator [Flavobacterium franklandianum]TRX15951.1 helix-turn-helix transcriptional regulator [Flavobacterium franklandianum]TRX27751.1 helix-turn-helix transcriptional regulator [Flavobacterium franklandianum]